MSLELPVKSLLHSFFLTDHLKSKTVKIKHFAEYPQQILANYSTLVRELSNYDDHFLRFFGFPDLFGKVFLTIQLVCHNIEIL